MKKIISFLLVVFAVILVACSESGKERETKKISGIVKKFNPSVGSGAFARGSVSVQFTDGRYFILNRMPEVQIEPGSEIAIYYKSRNEYQIFSDSVRIVKEAPKK